MPQSVSKVRRVNAEITGLKVELLDLLFWATGRIVSITLLRVKGVLWRPDPLDLLYPLPQASYTYGGNSPGLGQGRDLFPEDRCTISTPTPF